jgi:multimeric flavodoxin WrbA
MLIETVFEPLRAAGHDCELIELAGRDIRGCIACGSASWLTVAATAARTTSTRSSRLFEADAILGSPTYFADVSWS